MTWTAIRSSTSGAMMTDEESNAMAAGMKTGKGSPAKIDAIATHGNLLGLRPCRHDCRAGEGARAMNGAAP